MAWTKRHCRADAAGSGNGTTNANSGANGAWTLAEALANASIGQKVNLYGGFGTYAPSALITPTNSGDSTTPIWWNGCNTTEDDLNDVYDSVANFPFIDFSGAGSYAQFSNSFSWFHNIKIRSPVTTSTRAALYISGPSLHFHKCWLEGTAADVDSRGCLVAGTGDGAIFTACYFKGSSSADCLGISASAPTIVLGCVMDGGLRGVAISGTASVQGCLIKSAVGAGIDCSVANTLAVPIIGNTIYGCGTNGIALTNATTPSALIANNVIANNGAIGIAATNTPSSMIIIANNLFHSNVGGNLSAIIESFSLNTQTDSSSPFVNAAGNDFSLVSTSNGKNNGYPGRLFGFGGTSVGYLDIGGLQRNPALVVGGIGHSRIIPPVPTY